MRGGTEEEKEHEDNSCFKKNVDYGGFCMLHRNVIRRKPLQCKSLNNTCSHLLGEAKAQICSGTRPVGSSESTTFTKNILSVVYLEQIACNC